jgi:hypothetical protein
MEKQFARREVEGAICTEFRVAEAAQEGAK